MNTFKDKGNSLLRNCKFRNAYKMYTKALDIGVLNHILYGNRCQTALHMEDFWDALWDARRAVTIKPDWEKGHYRYAKAFFKLKDIDRALRVNKRGQKLCDDGGSQTRDLQRQATMFNDEKERLVSLNSKMSEVPDLVSESKTYSDSDSDCNGKSRKPRELSDINSDLEKSNQEWTKKKAEGVRKKKEEEERRHLEEQDQRRRRQQIMHDIEVSNKSTEENESRKLERNKKKAEKEERKRNEAEKQAQERLKREEKKRHAKELGKQAKREAEIARLEKELMRKENELLSKETNSIEKCLADGSQALVSGQSRQACTQYDRAAELLKDTNKEHGGMHEADYIVFLYAQATAYLKSGIPSEVNKALSRFENITKDLPNMRNGLPFYGLAASLFKLNRFSEALDPIEKSLFITTRFDQTIHTWPGTSTNIDETEEGKLEAALKELQHRCKNPPSADVTCMYVECTSKREMYFSDLDFKGYIKVQCSERCYINYHINCWKAIKNESNILGEKEALKTKCSTPDCLGLLSNIKVFGANGLIKTEFKVEKPPKLPKDEAKKRSTPKPTKDHKKGKRIWKSHQSESYKAEKGQGDAEGQPGHGQTAEGAHAEKEDTSSKSAHVATKPRTGSDAGIAVATDSTQNDASRIQTVEGAVGEAEIKPEATYVLKRDEFDDVEQTNKAQPKKSRKPVALLEEASNRKHLYGADNVEELQERKNRGWQSTLTVSEDRPCAIPEHLQDAARKMDTSVQMEEFINVPETDEEKSQKTALFLHFNEIFSSNGPLHLEDPIITGYMEYLTFEHQEVVAKRDGLKPFLLESEDIFVIGDYASMNVDAQKCRELAIRNGYQEREPSGDVAGYALNPNSVPMENLAMGLDQFEEAKRGPVSELDSFSDDDDSNEEPQLPVSRASRKTTAQAQAQAQAQQIQQAQNPPVVSQGEAAIQQAAMSGNGFNHHQQSYAIPSSTQRTQHQMQMWQQQGAVPRHPQQLTVQQQQQMPARQVYTEQVAQPKNNFERIMLRLTGSFPNHNKVQLTGFLKEVRISNNCSLSGLTVEGIIRRVKDLVRQRQRETTGNASQRKQNKRFANRQGMEGGRPMGPPATFNTRCMRSSYNPAHTVGNIQRGLNWLELDDGEEDEEDLCVICQEEMSGDNTLEIKCGHIFHIHCLRKWLKENQTCPTCRNFTILKDDYPSLHK